jgi:methionine synthase II (cobalamin-independent)
MRSSSTHILTSHAGSLPRPEPLIEANRARAAGEASDEQAFQAQLRAAVIDVVRQQKDLGIDIPGDGEFGKAMGTRSTTAPGGVIRSSAWVASNSPAARCGTCRRVAASRARSR